MRPASDESPRTGAADDPPRPPLRFRVEQRILRPGEFRRVYREGSRAKGALMTVCVRANGRAHARLGLSIGKSVWRDAADRNRVRRVFREAFRCEQHGFPPADIVLIGSVPKIRPRLDAARAELRKLAAKAWRRYGEKVRPR